MNLSLKHKRVIIIALLLTIALNLLGILKLQNIELITIKEITINLAQLLGALILIITYHIYSKGRII